MEAKELRIGNYIQDNLEDVFTVGGLTENGICINNFGAADIKGMNAIMSLSIVNFKPIPLTEEWLLNFGFTCDTSYDYFDEDIDRDVYCGYDIDTITLIMMDGYLVPKPYYDDEAFGQNVKIKYVHQLQNLYFALTGEELCLKDSNL